MKNIDKKLVVFLTIMNLLVIGAVIYIVFQFERVEQSIHVMSDEVTETMNILSPLIKNLELVSINVIEIGEAANLTYISLKKLKKLHTKLIKSQTEFQPKLLESLQNWNQKAITNIQTIREVVDRGKRVTDESGGNFRAIEQQLRIFQNIFTVDKLINFIKTQIFVTLALLIVISLFTSLIISRLLKQSQLAIKQAKLVANQRWVQSKLTELYDNIRGELNHTTLAQRIIDYLTPCLNALVGAIYNNDNGTLKLNAGYAYPTQPNETNQFLFGQGLIGQAAKEQKSILVSEIPDNCIKINSALGEMKPNHMLVTPFMLDGHVKGVIELGLFRPLSENQTLLLQQAAERIAISFKSAEYRNQMRILLKESQAQSEELQQQQKILEQQQQELEQNNSQLETFARTVAHDLKNPLNTVIGYSDELVEICTEDNLLDAELMSQLVFVAKAGHKMEEIINALLLLAKTSKGGNIDTQPLDMPSIIAQAQERLIYMIKGCQAEISIAKNFPVVLGYAPWVEEVWANYISNGIKYGGLPPKLELGADVQDDNMIRFWVRDNGPGLSKENLAKLFTAFTRLHQNNAEGHGLGLSIVQQIIEKLNGKIGAESIMGQGSTFYFTLPKL
ncbi:GAF domain-containing sensor histidine kinase [Candidatus Halobeggiatoa sp. HSG11]|nr:GAF domain-containing sensor histidine kinase [Candidatus Halobeggiatoa sp. HSG11]